MSRVSAACVAQVGAAPPSGHRLRPDQEAPWPHLAGVDGSAVDVSSIPGPEACSHDFVRLDDLTDGWYAIVNPHHGVGFALRWDRTLFPILGFWQVFRGGADYPWYGQPYLIALEPACDLPSLERAAARGAAIRLEPGIAQTTRFEATVFTGRADVNSVLPDGQNPMRVCKLEPRAEENRRRGLGLGRLGSRCAGCFWRSDTMFRHFASGRVFAQHGVPVWAHATVTSLMTSHAGPERRVASL